MQYYADIIELITRKQTKKIMLNWAKESGNQSTNGVRSDSETTDGNEVNGKERVISVHSLNQYKLQFVSNRRIGVIIVRSAQIVESTAFTANGSALCSCQINSELYILLQNATLLRYHGDRLVSRQLLS